MPRRRHQRQHQREPDERQSVSVGASGSRRSTSRAPACGSPDRSWRVYHGRVAMVRNGRGRPLARRASSLLAPLVLLVAAAVVASGGGLGGLGALGQVAGGPALPDLARADPPPRTDLCRRRHRGRGHLRADRPPARRRARARPGPLASGPQAAAAEVAAPRPAPDPVDVSPLPPAGSARSPRPPRRRRPRRPRRASSRRRPIPVDDVIENTRGVGESLPGPLGPTTGDILDLLPAAGSSCRPQPSAPRARPRPRPPRRAAGSAARASRP